MLIAQNISLSLGKKPILRQVNLEAEAGTFCVIMGANGAGKSTLLKVLAGEYTHYEGELMLAGKALRTMPLAEQARHRAVLSQRLSLAQPYTVAEVVQMGRYTYRMATAALNHAIIIYAMKTLQVYDLRDRSYLTLSGGQQQRVQMARVLAQLLEVPDLQGAAYAGKKMLLLDEPVTGMDILHQQLALQLAQQLTRQGVLVIAVLHDFQLAASYAQQLCMLHQGAVHMTGPVKAVLTPEHIETCFGIAVKVLSHPQYDYPLVVTAPPTAPLFHSPAAMAAKSY